MIYTVMNLHFLDACNYKCKYCFGNKFIKSLTLEQVKKAVDNTKNYFNTHNVVGRINLVGGEIFLCSYLQDIIDYIFDSGIKVSLVTNGSRLTKEFVELNKDKLETIGISVDSLKDSTNLIIGRSSHGKVINTEELIDVCKYIKECNIKLKINTVVTKLNIKEDFLEFFRQIKPDRLKLLHMKIVKGINEYCEPLKVSVDEFIEFANIYKEFNPVAETSSEMENSYIMINSLGNISYDMNNPLGNVLEEDMCMLLNNIDFDNESYLKRYE